MKIYGKILDVNTNHRIIKLKSINRIYYIYFQRKIYSMYKYFLKKNNNIYLNINLGVIKDKVKTYNANYIIKIIDSARRVLFDRDYLRASLAGFLESSNYYLFLDLENTMPPYDSHGNFTPEIIQMGYILYDHNYKEIFRYNEFIKPVNHEGINARTCKFLNLKQNQFYKQAISYYSMYNTFISVLKKYNPAIIIYGKNDELNLRKSYKLHNLPSLSKYTRFVNLSNLISEYYHFDKPRGLFKLYDEYYRHNDIQLHDALTDAYVTFLVYKAFKEDVKNDKNSLES